MARAVLSGGQNLASWVVARVSWHPYYVQATQNSYRLTCVAFCFFLFLPLLLDFHASLQENQISP